MAGRRFRLCLALILIFAARAHAASSVDIVVKILPTANLSLVTSLLNGTVIDSIPRANTFLIRLPWVPVLTPVVTPILRLVGVEWIESHQPLSIPSNPLGGLLLVPPGVNPGWYGQQPAFQLIHTDSALQHSTGRGTIIADINTKVDYGHPALAGRLTVGFDFVATRSANTASGFIDDQSDAGFLDDQSDAGFLDDPGGGILGALGIGILDGIETRFTDQRAAANHGTFCAGILASIAPDATIMPLRAFDDNGRSDVFTLAKAIRYATQQHADVINLSFGTLTNSRVLQEAIAQAHASGVILVASAGNANTSAPQYPAAYPGVIAVAATDLLDRKASFSNYGGFVFVDAPGVQIISSTPEGRYGFASGTSFSAPIVAGMAALMRSVTYTGVREKIAAGVVPIDAKNPKHAGKLGHGRVDLKKTFGN